VRKEAHWVVSLWTSLCPESDAAELEDHGNGPSLIEMDDIVLNKFKAQYPQ